MKRHATCIAVATLALAIPSALMARYNDAPPIDPSKPGITYIDQPSDDQREIVEWAVEQYRTVGLQLPDLRISFPVTCGGKAGRYFVGQGRVELCRPNRKLVLHEFAHAWDDHSSIDREAFLEMRGLDSWYEQPGERSNMTGGEQLALILAWGLMHVDVTHPRSEWAGQPLDEQPRYLPGLHDSSPEVLTEFFEMLTGASPLTPGRYALNA